MTKKVLRLSPKLVRYSDAFPYYAKQYAHWCPACDELHNFAVDEPFSNGAKWTFGGDPVKPSFNPSMNIRIGPNSKGRVMICHYFLRDGKLEYCGDSTHRLAGSTIDLPDIPEEQWQRWAANGV